MAPSELNNSKKENENIISGSVEKKCSWSDGKFNFCESYSDMVHELELLGLNPPTDIIFRYKYCPYCGADIRGDQPEPKAPTHEEIMNKWWEIPNGVTSAWLRVNSYCPETKTYSFPYVGELNESTVKFKAQWLNGRESADIPPEA